VYLIRNYIVSKIKNKKILAPPQNILGKNARKWDKFRVCSEHYACRQMTQLGCAETGVLLGEREGRLAL
jgi:hypothetical protein